MSANTAKHKTSYNRMWEADHTWVFYIDGKGMYCKLCRKFDTKNRQNQAKIWNKEPCTTIRKDVLARHEASAMHKEAVEQSAPVKWLKLMEVSGRQYKAKWHFRKCCYRYNEVPILAL